MKLALYTLSSMLINKCKLNYEKCICFIKGGWLVIQYAEKKILVYNQISVYTLNELFYLIEISPDHISIHPYVNFSDRTEVSMVLYF